MPFAVVQTPFPQKAEFPREPPSLPPLEAMLAAYLLELRHNRAGNGGVCVEQSGQTEGG